LCFIHGLLKKILLKRTVFAGIKYTVITVAFSSSSFYTFTKYRTNLLSIIENQKAIIANHEETINFLKEHIQLLKSLR